MLTPEMNYRSGLGRFSRPAALAALAFVFAGCGDVLGVDDPEFRSPDDLGTAEALPFVINGALRDFTNGYAGSGLSDRYVMMSGVLTDEWMVSDTFATRQATDQRNQFPTELGNTTNATYNDLHEARARLERAAFLTDSIRGADGAGTVAQLKALEGYTYLALGEGFCSGIPFSSWDFSTNVATYGQPLSTNQVFSEAIARFDAALTANPADNLALLGKARAMIQQSSDPANLAAAAALVANVPTLYVFRVGHSDNNQNAIFNLNRSNRRYTLADNEGINGVGFREALDTRVPHVRPSGTLGLGFDRIVPLWVDLRYVTQDVDQPIASGVEARLIEAEAALAAADLVTYLTRLQNLRDSVDLIMPAMYENWDVSLQQSVAVSDPGAITPPTTDAERLALLMEERGMWLRGQGYRLGDFRRLIRNYGLTEDQVFPTGAWHKGGNYGDDVNFPIPFTEANNPNWTPDMCNVQAP